MKIAIYKNNSFKISKFLLCFFIASISFTSISSADIDCDKGGYIDVPDVVFTNPLSSGPNIFATKCLSRICPSLENSNCNYESSAWRFVVAGEKIACGNFIINFKSASFWNPFNSTDSKDDYENLNKYCNPASITPPDTGADQGDKTNNNHQDSGRTSSGNGDQASHKPTKPPVKPDLSGKNDFTLMDFSKWGLGNNANTKEASVNAYYGCSQNAYANQVYVKLLNFINNYQKFLTLTEDLNSYAVSSGSAQYSAFLGDMTANNEDDPCYKMNDYIVRVKTQIEKLNSKSKIFCSAGGSLKKTQISNSIDTMDDSNLLDDGDLTDMSLDSSGSSSAFSGGKMSYNSKLRGTSGNATLGAEATKSVYLADMAFKKLYVCFKQTYDRAQAIAKKSAGIKDEVAADNQGKTAQKDYTDSFPGAALIVKFIKKATNSPALNDACDRLNRAGSSYLNTSIFDKYADCKSACPSGTSGNTYKAKSSQLDLQACFQAIDYNFKNKSNQNNNNNNSYNNNNYNNNGNNNNGNNNNNNGNYWSSGGGQNPDQPSFQSVYYNTSPSRKSK